MHEAMFYERREDSTVRCGLCAQQCVIADGERGKCSVRVNNSGMLNTLVYGRAAAMDLDPIEKKPLFHFQPGSASLSIGTLGCNLRCRFCQNWTLSRGAEDCDPRSERHLALSPQAIVEHCVNRQIPSVSFTYNEPTVFFEYAYDTCGLAREQGVRTVFVSNGYMSRAALDTLAPVLDAINVDFKSISDEFYRQICGGRVEPVMDNIRRIREHGIWLEVITLVIPGLNDTNAELSAIAAFIAGVDPDIPWHVNAFHPDYRMTDRPRTPVETLRRARRIGLDTGLRYVYVGNVLDSDTSATWCPQCGQLLIDRLSFRADAFGLEEGRCANCKFNIAGVWK